jgi:hypothetical protein
VFGIARTIAVWLSACAMVSLRAPATIESTSCGWCDDAFEFVEHARQALRFDGDDDDRIGRVMPEANGAGVALCGADAVACA